MEQTIDFKNYLLAKKVDASAFQAADSDLYSELETYFDQVHPDSFTAQKLFLINPLRRKYLLKDSEPVEEDKPKAVMKPKFKRP